MQLRLVTEIDEWNPILGDLFFSPSLSLEYVTGAEEVAQHLQQRLQFFLGEWFLDVRMGVPYFRDVFGKKQRNLNQIRFLFRSVITNTPGVARISKFSCNLDRTRTLRVNFVAITDLGERIDATNFAPFVLNNAPIRRAA